MYLYYFERVLRWAADDNTLRLPYWITPIPRTCSAGRIRDKTSTFHDGKRDPDINDGSAKLDANSTNVTPCCHANYFTYENSIDGASTVCALHRRPDLPGGPHGRRAGGRERPDFLYTHGNIDRLWACWQKLHPTPAEHAEQEFSFVDETGALQKKPVRTS